MSAMLKKIFVASSDKSLSGKLRRVFPGDMEFSFLEEKAGPNMIKKVLGGQSNLLFMDFGYLHWLKDPRAKAKVIVTSNSYDLGREYLSARLGANGFITRDIGVPSLKKAVNVVGSGQVWMTRAVSGIVFDEYRKIIR